MTELINPMRDGVKLTQTKFRTPEFRVSYPHLFEAQEGFKNQDGTTGRPSYNVTCLFDKKKTNLEIFDYVIDNVIDRKWKGKVPKKLKVKGINDGDDMETKDGDPKPETQGMNVIRFDAKNDRPHVLDASRDNIVDPSEIYGGCYAVAVVECYAYDGAYGKGVTFGLLAVQKTRDGDSLVGGFNVDDFEALERTPF